jgi:hypothetical protein
MIGLRGGLYRQLTFALEADFLQISTTGVHRFLDITREGSIDLQWTNLPFTS